MMQFPLCHQAKPLVLWHPGGIVKTSVKGCTLPKTNVDPENGTLKNCFPLQTSGFQGLC